MNQQHDEILQLLEKYKKSVWYKDLDAFLEIYDEDICAYDLWNAWSYEGLEAWSGMVKDWFSWLNNEKDDVSFHNTVVKSNQDFATLYTFIIYRGLSADEVELRRIQNRLTWVLQKKEGVWKVIHEHTSAPAKMDDMKIMTI